MFNPQTLKKLHRFRQIKLGYGSLIVLIFILLVSLIAEVIVNNRALIVKYDGEYFLPTYTSFHPGSDFGLGYSYETNYRELQKIFLQQQSNNWVLMPLVPFSPNENHTEGSQFQATAPSFNQKHFLGTDTTSRDILARLIYGTRIALFFSLGFMFFVYLIGVSVGGMMG
jgi:microcin C transport system permease protein